MKIEFIASQSVTEAPEALAVLAMEDGALSSAAQALDDATGGAVRRAIAASRFKGKAGQTLDLLAPAGLKA
ncbi:MAG: leucyl aminopeptidase, partial [Pseudomonadota bacterium]|nr:leucyl aminopeptidase [Pseudomonadota bacterium]